MAVGVIMRRDLVDQPTASAVLFDIAETIKVDVEELARLITEAELERPF